MKKGDRFPVIRLGDKRSGLVLRWRRDLRSAMLNDEAAAVLLEALPWTEGDFDEDLALVTASFLSKYGISREGKVVGALAQTVMARVLSEQLLPLPLTQAACVITVIDMDPPEVVVEVEQG